MRHEPQPAEAASGGADSPPTPGDPATSSPGLDTDSPGTAMEFRVAGAPEYDTSSPGRWIISHVLRYKALATSFLVATLLVAVLRSVLPVLTGQAFDLVAGPDATRAALVRLGVLVLATILAEGVMELASSFRIQTVGQRLQRDAREGL